MVEVHTSLPAREKERRWETRIQVARLHIAVELAAVDRVPGHWGHILAAPAAPHLDTLDTLGIQESPRIQRGFATTWKRPQEIRERPEEARTAGRTEAAEIAALSDPLVQRPLD